MSSTQLIAFFRTRQARGTPLVLVTVIRTEGSTYSKVGSRMLIDHDHLFHGLVSGGCLEGDLLEHAKKVFSTRSAITVTYDLRSDDDALWGLGAGCNGLIELLLQPLAADESYEPMRSLVAAYESEAAHTVDLVVDSAHPEVAPGTTSIAGAASDATAPSSLEPTLSRLREHAVAPGVSRFVGTLDGHPVTVLRQVLFPLPRILVLGAGADAVPVIEGLLSLGWRAEVGDHRESALQQSAFQDAARLHVVNDAALRDALDARPPNAVILMTHNLERDLRYLNVLADFEFVCIGVLGPRQRRERLLKALDVTARSKLENRLQGPVGLEIGADSPASIALSIVAFVFREIKKVMLSARPNEISSLHAEKQSAG